MAPAPPCCPPLACPARGQTGHGNIGIPSRTAQRFLCTEGRKTFTATKGTALWRRRTSVEPVSLVVTLMAHGCPLQALVVAFGYDERTVACWLARAGVQGQAVQEQLVEQPRDLGHVHADERRVKQQGDSVGMALALLVEPRVGRAGDGSVQREMPLIRRLIERVRRGALPRPLLCGPDGLCASIRAIRETFRDPVHTGVQGRPRWRPWRHLGLAQVVQRSVQRRVVAVERRSMDGRPARVERRRRRSHGDGVINTADIERLNATCRARLAPRARRGRALARHTLTLPQGMFLVGTVYNVCPYHASLRLAAPAAGTPLLTRTPARAAESTDHGWTVRELLSFQGPPPRWSPPTQRGPPARALKRLLARWCGDHGELRSYRAFLSL